MPRARLVSHPTLVPLGQPEKAMGHESQIEPWLAPDNRVLLVGLRTDWLRRKEAMKTAGRETHNRYTIARSVPRSRSGSRGQSCSIGRAGWQEKPRPQVKCFFLTPFIELHGSEHLRYTPRRRIRPDLSDLRYPCFTGYILARSPNAWLTLQKNLPPQVFGGWAPILMGAFHLDLYGCMCGYCVSWLFAPFMPDLGWGVAVPLFYFRVNSALFWPTWFGW